MSEELKNQVEGTENTEETGESQGTLGVVGISVADEEPQDQVEASEDSAADEAMDMEALMAQYGDAAEDIGRGKVVEGTIVSKQGDGWLVDVGYKCEGFLSEREWSHHILVDDASEPQIGDKVTVQVTNKRDGEEAQLQVSRWRCEFDRRWAELEEKAADGATFTVKGLRKVKGGLMVDCCSLEGFIPISHLAAEGRGVNPGRFIDEEFEVRLLEKDKRKRRLVLSRRSLLDEDLTQRREKFYAEVHAGDVLDGTVSSLTSFGAFVNVGPLDGLVHISEMSWQRSSKAREAIKKGDAVKVKVLSIDQEHNKISLSIRQAQGDPWETVMDRWTKGQRTTGSVTNITDFGAFVEVEPGIEGLIHIGDLSWTRVKHPREVLRKGQEVDTVILEIDPVKRRMSLGFKQLNDPWDGIEGRYSKGQDIAVKVVRLADFGAFVEIEKGVEGLIHISQLSTRRVEKPGEVLAEGQEVTARVLEVNPANRRIRLSLSAIEADNRHGRDDETRGDRRSSSAPRSSSGKPRRRESEKTFHSFQADDTGFTFGDALGDFKFDDNE